MVDGMGRRPPVLRPRQAQVTATLAALGAWSIVVPALGHALGLGVDVAGRVEIVDHVLPGAVVAVAATRLTVLARRRSLTGSPGALVASGACFLAGFWMLVTHVPLVADAARGREPWGAALWHATAAAPVVILAAWCVLVATAPRAATPSPAGLGRGGAP